MLKGTQILILLPKLQMQVFNLKRMHLHCGQFSEREAFL